MKNQLHGSMAPNVTQRPFMHMGNMMGALPATPAPFYLQGPMGMAPFPNMQFPQSQPFMGNCFDCNQPGHPARSCPFSVKTKKKFWKRF